ncbi:hypothetical protein IMZ48_15060, partial [Candidatus Bathyarchaeota archaeon]|nr:hypothetical protein [Candidatus Bathyarchaeota archaeon]
MRLFRFAQSPRLASCQVREALGATHPLNSLSRTRQQSLSAIQTLRPSKTNGQRIANFHSTKLALTPNAATPEIDPSNP